MNVTKDTELRSLPPHFRMNLCEMLDLNDAWKRVAAVIRNPDKPEKLQYTAAHVDIFESSRQQGRSPTSSLFSDWETRGRVRATVQDLLDILNSVKLYYAANYVAVNILRGDLPLRPDADQAADMPPENYDSCPAANAQSNEGYWPPTSTGQTNIDGQSTSSSTSDSSSNSTRSSDISSVMIRVPDQESGGGDNAAAVLRVDSAILDTDGIRHFSYAQLSECTNGFVISLGHGAFGEVYWGELPSKTQVAVKKLSFDARTQFMIELRIMAKYRHPNLLPLLGFSNDDVTACCLVSPFMSNGSLEDRLAQKNGTAPLTWQIRLNVAIGTARGIVHLHTYDKEPLVHRDIKSANILLDDKFQAKVGDFGIARIGGDWQKTTKMMTSNISGTCAYMSNEAFQGNVTVMMDTFSFGIVLLELLTGLAPDDPTRENRNLLSHVKESDEEMSAQKWKDPKAGDWADSVVERLLDLALRNTKNRMKKRPLMEQVLQELEETARHVLP